MSGRNWGVPVGCLMMVLCIAGAVGLLWVVVRVVSVAWHAR
jgi:hypothetical protein